MLTRPKIEEENKLSHTCDWVALERTGERVLQHSELGFSSTILAQRTLGLFSCTRSSACPRGSVAIACWVWLSSESPRVTMNQGWRGDPCRT